MDKRKDEGSDHHHLRTLHGHHEPVFDDVLSLFISSTYLLSKIIVT
jgi:hypothetical protein